MEAGTRVSSSPTSIRIPIIRQAPELSQHTAMARRIQIDWTGWGLNLIYLCLLAVLAPWLVWKSLRTGRYQTGWNQKFRGAHPVRLQLTQGTAPAPPRVWLHAVSVGEVLQLRQVVAELQRWRCDLDLVISTTTTTGFHVARENFTDAEVVWFPLDFTWSVQSALDRLQPDLVVLVELELWPNFIRAATARHIPVALVNGRISDRSFRGYCRLKFLIAPLLQQLAVIGAQAPETRERLLALGALAEQLEVTGSLKFDGVRLAPRGPQVAELRSFFELKPGNPVWVAGSTQSPEEELILRVYQEVLETHPEFRLILAPRHPERGDALAQLIEEQGFAVQRRGRPKPAPAESQSSATHLSKPHSTAATIDNASLLKIGLLDTVGELGDCWALADVAFVGGSFGDRGGQNMLEPAAYGIPVCYGPNTRNFRHIVTLLEQTAKYDASAAAYTSPRTVQDAAELRDFILDSLEKTAAASEMGRRARELILSQQGATQRTVELLKPLLADEPLESRQVKGVLTEPAVLPVEHAPTTQQSDAA